MGIGGGDRVHCPFCRHPDSRVIDSRTADDGTAIRRRRSCPECGRRFTTQETVILMVAKRSGVTEPFTRDKIVRGVQRACQGRPVTEDKLAILAQQVEETIRARGLGEVPSHEVGLAILGPLRELDEVAYLRFASVSGIRVAGRLRGRDHCPAPGALRRRQGRGRRQGRHRHGSGPGVLRHRKARQRRHDIAPPQHHKGTTRTTVVTVTAQPLRAAAWQGFGRDPRRGTQ